MFDAGQIEVDRVLAEARSVPGGSYPPADAYGDPEFARAFREVKNADIGARVPGSLVGEAFRRWVLTGAESKGLVEDTAGVIIVPEEYAVDIATVARTAGTIRSLADVRTARSNKQRAGLLSASSVGWGRLESGTSVTDAAISVGSQQDIDVHDVLAQCQVGVDELNDAVPGTQQAIVNAIGIAIGEAEDLAFAAGSGSGQPKGLALAANVARVPAGQKTAAAASATPVLADVLGLPWKLPTRYRNNAVWLMSEDMAPKIAALTYANGSGIMDDAGEGTGPLGWPYFVVPGLPAATPAGTTDPSVWFIDVKSAYRVLDRGPVTVTRLEQKYAELGQVALIVKQRVGGDLVRPDACAIYTL